MEPMPERYLNDPELMARTLKRVVGATKWLSASVAAIALWVGVITGMAIADRGDERAERQQERHDDCLAALEARDAFRDIDIEQWVTAVENSGPNPEGVAFATEFITRQYEEMELPGPCT